MECQISIKYDNLLSMIKNSMFAKHEDVFATIPSPTKQNNDLLGDLSGKKSFSKNSRSKEQRYHFEYLMCLISSIVLIVLMKKRRI